MLRRGHNSRLGVVVTLLAILIAGCEGEEGTPATNQDNATGEAVFNLPVPMPEPPLDRGALLSAVAQATSASAVGREGASASKPELDGRQFEFRIRFGCRGPVENDAERWLGWSFDPEARRLSVEARPTISRAEPLLSQLDVGAFEAVEGFWIPRPWLLEAACPVSREIAAISKPEPQTEAKDAGKSEATTTIPAWRIGLAQFFSAADPRTTRRDGKPYEFVRTLAEGTTPGTDGFNLVLAGRLRALPGKGVILCAGAGPEDPPDCIVSVDLDRVWIEKPEDQEIIAEWRAG